MDCSLSPSLVFPFKPLQVESSLELEKKTRAELERTKRKLEGDLKLSMDSLKDLENQKEDMEDRLKKCVGWLFPAGVLESVTSKSSSPFLQERPGAGSSPGQGGGRAESHQPTSEEAEGTPGESAWSWTSTSSVPVLERWVSVPQTRAEELEEALEAERAYRTKAERQRNEMARELEELGEKLEEAGGASAAQIALNR